MRFPSLIVFAVITALASSISATSDTAGDLCVRGCLWDEDCVNPKCWYDRCWFFLCFVSRVFGLTLMQYGR
ncbi:uncharacterized protein EDB93DRAFT_1184705 [Suillus bovinus]|uniref:uncharacterized protein n=1 Tax=Suillus bovinus TaxID=48563 RepID=UPI001B864A02|nr:uncharacterized protein EDB93DRAFT_1184705 [Suillus bovinus]KAG2128327.1 hypothetical protein EDB93DRAFT_1184705 [Suillus bovinus]